MHLPDGSASPPHCTPEITLHALGLAISMLALEAHDATAAIELSSIAASLAAHALAHSTPASRAAVFSRTVSEEAASSITPKSELPEQQPAGFRALAALRRPSSAASAGTAKQLRGTAAQPSATSMDLPLQLDDMRVRMVDELQQLHTALVNSSNDRREPEAWELRGAHAAALPREATPQFVAQVKSLLHALAADLQPMNRASAPARPLLPSVSQVLEEASTAADEASGELSELRSTLASSLQSTQRSVTAAIHGKSTRLRAQQVPLDFAQDSIRRAARAQVHVGTSPLFDLAEVSEDLPKQGRHIIQDSSVYSTASRVLYESSLVDAEDDTAAHLLDELPQLADKLHESKSQSGTMLPPEPAQATQVRKQPGAAFDAWPSAGSVAIALLEQARALQHLYPSLAPALSSSRRPQHWDDELHTQLSVQPWPEVSLSQAEIVLACQPGATASHHHHPASSIVQLPVDVKAILVELFLLYCSQRGKAAKHRGWAPQDAAALRSRRAPTAIVREGSHARTQLSTVYTQQQSSALQGLRLSEFGLRSLLQDVGLLGRTLQHSDVTLCIVLTKLHCPATTQTALIDAGQDDSVLATLAVSFNPPGRVASLVSGPELRRAALAVSEEQRQQVYQQREEGTLDLHPDLQAVLHTALHSAAAYSETALALAPMGSSLVAVPLDVVSPFGQLSVTYTQFVDVFVRLCLTAFVVAKRQEQTSSTAVPTNTQRVLHVLQHQCKWVGQTTAWRVHMPAAADMWYNKVNPATAQHHRKVQLMSSHSPLRVRAEPEVGQSDADLLTYVLGVRVPQVQAEAMRYDWTPSYAADSLLNATYTHRCWQACLLEIGVHDDMVCPQFIAVAQSWGLCSLDTEPLHGFTPDAAARLSISQPVLRGIFAASLPGGKPPSNTELSGATPMAGVASRTAQRGLLARLAWAAFGEPVQQQQQQPGSSASTPAAAHAAATHALLAHLGIPDPCTREQYRVWMAARKKAGPALLVHRE